MMMTLGTRLRRAADTDRGAAAVEFALVLPILITVVLGIIDFGFAFNTQISLTQAAREGVRYEALDMDDPEGEAETAFNSVSSSTGTATLEQSCDSQPRARLSISSTYDFMLPFIDETTLSGEAVMRCGG